MPAFTLVSSTAFLIGLSSLPALAQDAPKIPDWPVGAIRAELRAARSLYSPDDAVRLRFTLINVSDQPVAIPLDYPISTAGGIALPVQLALGSGQRGLLSVIYEDEEAKVVPPPAPPGSTPGGSRALHLAPHGAVGAEIDLREHYPTLRYSGTYHVEWRPFEGQLGVLAAELRIEQRMDAILVTDLGKITFALLYDRAPRNVASFLDLVRAGFYDGKTFHRVVPGFVIQGGCPKGDGTGTRPGSEFIPAEFHDHAIDVGTLVMARKPNDPNSASCQFFIALGRLEELDGQYTVLGQTRDEESLRTLQHLAEVPTDQRDRPLSPLTIRSINLVSAKLNSQTHRIESVRQQSSAPTTPPE